jgi:hypothetical protein
LKRIILKFHFTEEINKVIEMKKCRISNRSFFDSPLVRNAHSSLPIERGEVASWRLGVSEGKMRQQIVLIFSMGKGT